MIGLGLIIRMNSKHENVLQIIFIGYQIFKNSTIFLGFEEMIRDGNKISLKIRENIIV